VLGGYNIVKLKGIIGEKWCWIRVYLSCDLCLSEVLLMVGVNVGSME